MSLIHRCIVVPDALASAAAAMTGRASPAGGGMFIQALGTEEAGITHRFSNGPISEQFAAILPLDWWDGDAGQFVRVYPGSAVHIAAMSGDPEAKAIVNPPPPPPEPEPGEPEPEPAPEPEPLPPVDPETGAINYYTIAQVQALLDASVCTADGWEVTAGNMGLVRIEGA